LAQYICVNGVEAVAGNVAQRQQVDVYMREVDADALAVGDDPAAISLVDERPQATQAPPQRGARIVRYGPEHRAEPVAAVRAGGRAGGDGKIGEQGSRLLRAWQQELGLVTQHREAAQDAKLQRRFPCTARTRLDARFARKFQR